MTPGYNDNGDPISTRTGTDEQGEVVVTAAPDSPSNVGVSVIPDVDVPANNQVQHDEPTQTPPPPADEQPPEDPAPVDPPADAPPA